MIESPADVLTLAENLRSEFPGDPLIWRGQPEYDWGLRPTIGRPHFLLGQEVRFDKNTEMALLIRFRRYAYLHQQRALSEWENLLLAREHGLPVRALDWTTNPLVALYFACWFARLPCPDAAVWILVRTRLKSLLNGSLIDPFGDSNPLELNGVRVIYPMAISERMVVQSGVHTIQSDPYENLDCLAKREFPEEDLDVVAIIKCKVPGLARVRIIHTLEQFDINSRRLFPDYNGLCQSLWETEVLKRSKGQYVQIR